MQGRPGKRRWTAPSWAQVLLEFVRHGRSGCGRAWGSSLMDHVKQGTDTLFILLGAVMVLAMHAGFAFLELLSLIHI